MQRVPVLVLPDLLAAMVVHGSCRLVNSRSPLPRVAFGQPVLIGVAREAMAPDEAASLFALMDFAVAAGCAPANVLVSEIIASRGRVVGSCVLVHDVEADDMRGRPSEAWFVGPHAWSLREVVRCSQPGGVVPPVRQGLHWLDRGRLVSADN